MSRFQKTTIGVAIAVIVISIAGIMTVMWRSTGDNDHQVAAEDTLDPVAEDAEMTAKQAMVNVFSFNPAEDESPESDLAAIRDSLTGDLLTLADNPPEGEVAEQIRPRQWDAWAESGDSVKAFAEKSTLSPAIPADSDHARIKLEVTQKVLHSDGDITPFRYMTVTVDVEHSDGRWKASDYRVDDIN